MQIRELYIGSILENCMGLPTPALIGTALVLVETALLETA